MDREAAIVRKGIDEKFRDCAEGDKERVAAVRQTIAERLARARGGRRAYVRSDVRIVVCVLRCRDEETIEQPFRNNTERLLFCIV